MPLSEEKKKELRDLEAKAAKILKEMEDKDEQEKPKRALTKRKRMGSKYGNKRGVNIHQRKQLKSLDEENS